MKNQETITANELIDQASRICTEKPKLSILSPSRLFIKMDDQNLKKLVSELQNINKNMPENRKFFLACSKINEAHKNAKDNVRNSVIWNLLHKLLIDSMGLRNDWDRYIENITSISCTLDEEEPDKQKRKQLEEFRSDHLKHSPIDDKLNELSEQINKEIPEKQTQAQPSSAMTDKFDNSKMEQDSDSHSDNAQYVFGR